MDQEPVSVQNGIPPALETSISKAEPMLEVKTLHKEDDVTPQKPAGDLAVRQSSEVESPKEIVEPSGSGSGIPDLTAPVTETTQADKPPAKPVTASVTAETQSLSSAHPVEPSSAPRSMTAGSSPAPSSQHAARRRSTMDVSTISFQIGAYDRY